jgi:ABC-2 type transport system permease protein
MLSVSLANMLQYRAVMLLWAAWGIVAPLVALAVWVAAAGGRTLSGYGKAEFAGYFLVTMVVSHLATAWDMEVFSWEVRSGRLSPRLLRPVLPIAQAAAENVGYKVYTVAVLLPVWLLLGYVLRPSIHITWERAAWLVLVLPMAAALAFVWGYCVALLAFWTTNTRAFNELYYTGMGFLAGRYAPLALMPPALQALSWAFPFRWIVAFPVELALGRTPLSQALPGLLWQVGWLAVGSVAFRALWAQGVRQYSAVGA